MWLEHDPADFGVHPSLAHASVARTPGGVLRTGFTEAWLTDAEDYSYDLSWFNDLPDADRPAIARLRGLLAAERDPIDGACAAGRMPRPTLPNYVLLATCTRRNPGSLMPTCASGQAPVGGSSRPPV